MDTLSVVVQYISAILHLHHIAQLGWNDIGWSRPIPLRTKSHWGFGARQSSVCSFDAERTSVADTLYDRHLWPPKRTFSLSKCVNVANQVTLQWAPIQFKLVATSILQHVGGIHSGCALSGAG